MTNKLSPTHEFEIQLQAIDERPAMEFVFHPERKWRLDYAWPELKVAVEVHGGIHNQGRHVRGMGFQGDREKSNEAQLLGWRVLEVTPEHVSTGQALRWLEDLLSKVRRAKAQAGA